MVQVKAGWWQTRDGSRAYVQGPVPGNGNFPFTGVVDNNGSDPDSWSSDGTVYGDGDECDNDLVEYLDNCTGWDWEKPTAGEGYEFVAVGDVILAGDEYQAVYGWDWRLTCCVGKKVDTFDKNHYRRKIKPGASGDVPEEGYRFLKHGEDIKPGDRKWSYCIHADKQVWMDVTGGFDCEHRPYNVPITRKIQPEYPRYYKHRHGFGCNTMFIRRDGEKDATVVSRTGIETKRDWCDFAWTPAITDGTYVEITKDQAEALIVKPVPAPLAIDPGKGYRILDKSELVQEGDKLSHDNKSWLLSENWKSPSFGKQTPVAIYRRKIVQSDPEYRMLGRNETIMYGDEFYSKELGWSKCQSSIGSTPSKQFFAPFREVRRKVAVEKPVDPEYRILSGGEILCCSDEFKGSDGKWCKTQAAGEKIGSTPMTRGLMYRRKIEPVAAPEPVPVREQKYRVLMKGETIQKGDECLEVDSTWFKTIMVGGIVGANSIGICSDFVYRRPL